MPTKLITIYNSFTGITTVNLS